MIFKVDNYMPHKPTLSDVFISGLTKRELFAYGAMTGLISKSNLSDEEIVKRSVKIANLLIEKLTFEPAITSKGSTF